MRRAILVGIDSRNEIYDINYTLNELEALANECDIKCVGKMIQKGDINNLTYIGSGKVQELIVEIKMLEADCVIFNDELSPAMHKNLSELIDVTIMDRSYIVLQIFLSHARSNEAKLEVKLANLRYMYPRLSSLRDGFDRQSGLGNKGSGETQLELDRRHILNEISRIEHSLEESHNMKHRQIERRKKEGLKTVALVGYTNAGKSTTLNSIIEYTNKDESKKVLSKDQLFATLETAVRRIDYNQTSFLLTDTIGFVSKLPSHLVNSFRETLMEAKDADLIIHVLDVSSKYAYLEFQTTMQVLERLGISNQKMLILLNKADLCDALPSISGVDYLAFSNKTGLNLDVLLKYIVDYLEQDMINTTIIIPYEDGKMLNYVRENTKIISQISLNEGYQITLKCAKNYYKKLSIYEPNDTTFEA